MANLTINQLERFTELAMDYAAAISSGSVTNSATLQQIMDKFLSAQAGNAGKFLTTDGTNASWQAPLPDQTGQNGKFLTTNGTAASWGTVDLSPYEVTANKAQDLTSPSATTYPSTQAVVNESNRIISIIDTVGTGYVTAQSLGQNGYVKFSTGIIIQWGYNSKVGHYRTNFPISFSGTNTYAVAITGRTYSRGFRTGADGEDSDYNTASYFVSTNGSHPTNMYWIAVGY